MIVTGIALLLALLQPAVDSWSDAPGVPVVVGDGGGMVAIDGTTLFVVAGGDRRECFRRGIGPNDPWVTLAPAPANIGPGSAIAFHPGLRAVFLVVGGTRQLYRYVPDAGAGQWTRLPDAPVTKPWNAGTALAVAGGRLFATGGIDSPREFLEYDGGGAWSFRSPTPAEAGPGTSMAAPDPDGDSIYAVRALGKILYDPPPSTGYRLLATQDFWRYSISARAWTTLPPVPVAVGNGAALTAVSPSALLCMGSNENTFLYRFDIAAAAWTKLDAAGTMPAAPNRGSAIVRPSASADLVFGLRGSTSQFWSYSLSQDRFLSAEPALPDRMTGGASIVAVGRDDLYATQGGRTTGFWHYSIPSRTWSQAPDIRWGNQMPVDAGGSLAWDGGDFIYASSGATAGSNLFSRFSIGSQVWQGCAGLPQGLSWIDGSAIAYAGGDAIYGSVSGDEEARYLVRYSISSNTWEIEAGLNDFGPGGGLVSSGDDAIWFLAGGGSYTFQVYSQSRHAWNVDADGSAYVPPSHPSGVDSGGAMCCFRGRSILVFNGLIGLDRAAGFWSYSLVTRSWSRLADAPASTGPGTTIAAAGEGASIAYVLAANSSRTMWSYRADAPQAPAALTQLHLSDDAPVSQGEKLNDPGLRLQATASHPGGRPVRLRVEASPFGGDWRTAGTARVESASGASGTTFTVRCDGLANGSYRWRACSMLDSGVSSDWVEFGAASADFSIRYPKNDAPLPAEGRQQSPLDGSLLETGADILDETGIVLCAPVLDPEADTVSVEFEIRPLGSAFAGQATVSTLPVSSGGLASVVLHPTPGTYHWQFRLVDTSIYANSTDWSSFGANAEGDPDFKVRTLGGSLGRTHLCSVTPAGPGPGPVIVLLAALALMAARAR